MIHHFKLQTEGFSVTFGESYSVVEAPKGEFGVYLYARGDNKPYRCRIKSPGFLQFASLEFYVPGFIFS